MKISASILNDKIKPNKLVCEFNDTNVDYIHLDIMDGKFVKNKTWTIGEVEKILKDNKKKLDVHLMVNNPSKYISSYALLNTEYITFHAEAVKNKKEIIEEIKNYGLKAGISIKPNTNIKEIEDILDEIDLVLVMSVEPGLSGQTFLESVLYKIEVLDKLRKEKNYNYKIEVDGGINDTNITLLKERNVDIIVSASYLHENIKDNLKKLQS